MLLNNPWQEAYAQLSQKGLFTMGGVLCIVKMVLPIRSGSSSSFREAKSAWFCGIMLRSPTWRIAGNDTERDHENTALGGILFCA